MTRQFLFPRKHRHVHLAFSVLLIGAMLMATVASCGEESDSEEFAEGLSEMTALPPLESRAQTRNAENGAPLVSNGPSSLAAAPVKKLLAPDGKAGDAFGHSIAVSGDQAVVGAIDHEFGANTDIGAKYHFVGASWFCTEAAEPYDGGAYDAFGTAVALDGDTIVVGSPGHDVGSHIDQGAVYVYRLWNGVWNQEAKLMASDGAADDQFGIDVSLSGNTIVVAAQGADNAGNNDQGAAYVFVRNGTTWTQQAKLVAADGVAGDMLARARISGDTILLGAQTADVAGKADQGVGYVFVRNGTTWTQQAKLVTGDGNAQDLCGVAVGLDGDTAILGCRQHDIGILPDQGAAYVFIRNSGVWSQQAKLIAPDGASNDWFGVATRVKGNLALVGATNHDVGSNAAQGVAYTFQRIGTTWTFQTQFIANDGEPGDGFGIAIDVSGSQAFIGADRATINGRANQGAAYVFDIVFPPANVGEACVTNSGCATDFCVDGVCCDSPCTDTCMACTATKKGSGINGVCGTIAYDQDPDEECPDGACNGKNACQFYNGTPCTLATQCLSNYCVDQVCCGNICMGECMACTNAKKGTGYDGVCGTIAANTNPDNECVGGTCDGGGACSIPRASVANGEPCISAAQCESGYCADGVCCDSWCLGSCQACTASIKGNGADGACGPITQNTDPENECFGGSCDGSNTCKRMTGTVCATSNECASGFCIDSVCCENSCNDGCEACSTAKKRIGANGICGPIAMGHDPDAECNPGACNGSGTCNQPQTLLANGAACVTYAQCSSGSCVDGVCCDTPCAATCTACTAVKKGGGSDGECGPIAYDTDPDDECIGGACDGQDACRFYNGATCTDTTQCLSNYCVDGYCCNNICENECMACSNAKKGSGYDGACGFVAANTNPDGECVYGKCDGIGKCQYYNGVTCTAASQCMSGYCADGYCCGAVCTGPCLACSSTKTGGPYNGQCLPIAAGTDPDEECPNSTCNGSGACAAAQGLPSGSACTQSSECSSGHCADNVCCDTACSASCEACTAAKKGHGSDGTCGFVAANTNPDGECVYGKCDGTGKCQYYNGVTCTAASQCMSGYCADGYCCGAVCTGPCLACSSAKTGGPYNGQCLPIAAGTDPDEECPNSTCNGSGACQ